MEKTHFSKGEWSSEASLSSDLHNIRYITADGKRIASVCLRNDLSQEVAIANAMLMKSAPNLLEKLMEVKRCLVAHPDFKQKNTSIHYLVGEIEKACIAATGTLKPDAEKKQQSIHKDLLGVVGNFGFRLLRNGDAYGLDNCLVWESEEPGVEFYMLTGRTGKRFPGRGWFVSRYYYTSLMSYGDPSCNKGLCLDGGLADEASLSASEMKYVMDEVFSSIAKFATADDITRWVKSWHIKK